MKIKELVNTCQNQWKGLFGYDDRFTLLINDNTNRTKTKYKWVDLKDTDKYLLELRNKEVLYWEMWDRHELIIDIE